MDKVKKLTKKDDKFEIVFEEEEPSLYDVCLRTRRKEEHKPRFNEEQFFIHRYMKRNKR